MFISWYLNIYLINKNSKFYLQFRNLYLYEDNNFKFGVNIYCVNLPYNKVIEMQI